jgi:PTS system nitrogen regulatory IIA component
MDIKDFLQAADAIIDMPASGKAQLLRELANRAAKALGVSTDLVCSELMKRESLGSTGTGGGVAIPHARLPELKKPFGILVRLRQPIDFEAIDAQPVDIVFLLLLPDRPAGEQLNVLAGVARKLRIPATLRALRSAHDPAAFYRVITDKSAK